MRATADTQLQDEPDRGRIWRPTRREVAIGIGLAFYLAWVDCTFHGSQLVAGTPSGYPGFDANRTLYYVSIASLCLTLLACAVLHGRAAKLLYRQAAVKTAPVVMCLSTLLILAMTQPGALGRTCTIAAGILTGVSSAVCLFHWGALASALDTREIVSSACIGFVASDLLSALFQAIATLMPASPGVVGASLVTLDALFSLVAGLILLGVARQGDALLDVTVQVCEKVPAAREAQGRAHVIVARTSVAIVIVGFVACTCRELAFLQGGHEGFVGGMPGVYLGKALLVTVVASFILAAFLSADPQKNVARCYRGIFVLTAASVCLMPAAFYFGTPTLGVSVAVALGATECCYIVMWVTTAGICRKYRSRTTQYFAIVRLCWAVGPLLGNVFCLALATRGIDGAAFYVYLALCTLALFAMYAAVLTEGLLTEALAIIPHKYRRPFKERCAALARQYGLTDRELEVMLLFAKGRDSAYIQRELSLSKSTVSTHRQHIYAKLDVHSQQELLNRLYELETPA